MSTFVTVTPKDSMVPQLVNLDNVEMIDVSPPTALPPLDSPQPITAEHLGFSVLHFTSGRTPMVIIENAEDLQALGITTDKKSAVREAHDKKIAEIHNKRAKERIDAEKAALTAKHAADEKELKAKEAATAHAAPHGKT